MRELAEEKKIGLSDTEEIDDTLADRLSSTAHRAGWPPAGRQSETSNVFACGELENCIGTNRLTCSWNQQGRDGPLLPGRPSTVSSWRVTSAQAPTATNMEQELTPCGERLRV